MPASRSAESLLRLTAAALTAWLFGGAALATPALAGAGTFGRPPELAIAWLLTGLAAAWWLLRAPDRAALARRLALVLLTTTVLGQRGVPGDGGARLALLAVTLAAALPWLAAGRASLLAAAALALALPGLLGTEFPQGSVLWLTYVLPPAALALLVPSLFGAGHAGRVALVLLLATSVLCGFALASYWSLADGLQLPLAAVLATRLRLLGLHPNLAVPHLVTTLLLAAGLALHVPPRMRPLLALAALPVLLALLAVRSRTGLLALGFGGGLFALARLRGLWQPRVPLLRWAPALAALAVAGLLLWPALGAGSRPALQRDPSMASKAVSFRASMWELGRAACAAAPWHGFGPGTAYVQGRFAQPGVYEGLPKDDHPHNVVLAVREAFGWPGLAALALLFAGSVLPSRRGSALADAAGAALLALWAANAIDLGGADATLYPALVFLLLGLREGAAHEALDAAQNATHRAGSTRGAGATRHASAADRGLARTVPWLAAACALLGLGLAAGEACERRASAGVEAAQAALHAGPGDATAFTTPTAAAQAAAAETLAWIDRAELLQPFDPNVPLLRARFCNQRQQPQETLAAVLQARELFPGSAALAQQAALVLFALAPDDPRVDEWLAEAVRLDPYGPDSWRRHLDRARVASRRGHPDDAFAALFAAVLQNPSAVADLPRTGTGDGLRVHPAGAALPGIPVAQLQEALAQRRAAAQDVDPDEAARLRLRGVEILQALGETGAAGALAQQLLSGDELYLQTRTAQSCVAAGRIDEAVERLRGILGLGVFATRGELLDALSRATPLDADAFGAQLADSEARMARDVDVVFELDTVRRILGARLRCAERSGDLALAVRLSDAVAFAQR